MIILSCNDICLSFGTDIILDKINMHIQDTDKVGIVGVNGAGKSTLFKIITSVMQPDSGVISTARSHVIGYLEQNSGLDCEDSIWAAMLSVYSGLIEMEQRLKFLEAAISSEQNEDRLSPLMKEYASLSDRFSRYGGYEYNSRVRGVLRGLGFEDHQFSLKISVLSGGQKTRLALAKLLLEEPDILLLDEPTNHLDIQALEWLEEYLKSYRKCVLVISHDRYFLDAVTNRTIELENCCCKTYQGNYSEFLKLKAADREIQQKHYELQQKEITRMEAFIEQQKRWNREKNIIAAESRQKAIDRMEKIDKPADLPGKIKISFRTSIISGNDVLFVENLSKEYPGKPLFRSINFKLRKNERVFLLGPNGCGKSTLLKVLCGKLRQTDGIFEYGHKVKVGYYDQEHEELNDNNMVIEEVWSANEKLTQTELRNALASFLFKGEDVFKPVSILSGGEKSRVALLKLMLSGANFLVLDEPTNHLDINSREVLEEALTNFDGTMLVVSHDRYLINKLASRILEIDHHSLIDYSGNYAYYLNYRNKSGKDDTGSEAANSISAAKLEHLTTKEEKARQRKLEKQLAETEDEIGQIEKRLEEINTEMEAAATDHIKLMQLQEEHDSSSRHLETLYELWAKLSEE